MRTVLLVDDNDLLRETIRSCLEAEGFRVLEANNGEVALSILESLPADLRPLGVVTDVNMPLMSGEKLIDEIRSRGQDRWYSRIPIVIITSKEVSDIDKQVLSSVQAVLIKPFEIADLVAKIEAT